MVSSYFLYVIYIYMQCLIVMINCDVPVDRSCLIINIKFLFHCNVCWIAVSIVLMIGRTERIGDIKINQQ